MYAKMGTKRMLKSVKTSMNAKTQKTRVQNLSIVKIWTAVLVDFAVKDIIELELHVWTLMRPGFVPFSRVVKKSSERNSPNLR